MSDSMYFNNLFEDLDLSAAFLQDSRLGNPSMLLEPQLPKENDNSITAIPISEQLATLNRPDSPTQPTSNNHQTLHDHQPPLSHFNDPLPDPHLIDNHLDVHLNLDFHHPHPVPDLDVTLDPTPHACAPPDPATRIEPNFNPGHNTDQPHHSISLKAHQNDHTHQYVDSHQDANTDANSNTASGHSLDIAGDIAAETHPDAEAEAEAENETNVEADVDANGVVIVDAEGDLDADLDGDPDPESDEDENDPNEDDCQEHTPMNHISDAPNPSHRKRKMELHRHHSKRYRDNLGELFTNLELLLPRVLPGCKTKTKSHIISNSIRAITRLRSEVNTLEMQYILSSSSNRTKWVEDTVSTSKSFQQVVQSFMRLVAGVQRWKHCQLWERVQNKSSSNDPDSQSPVTTITNTTNDTGSSSTQHNFLFKLWNILSPCDDRFLSSQHFRDFLKHSENCTFTPENNLVIRRILTSLSPAWIDLTDDTTQHAHVYPQAKQCGFTVCFAVPFLVRGHVRAIVFFFDYNNRVERFADSRVAHDLASSLGNCYGAISMQ